MRSGAARFLTLLSFSLWSGNVDAVPPPVAPTELEKQADAIVEGESAFVVCNGIGRSGNARLQQYVATIKPSKWLKGAHSDALAVEGAIALDPLPPGPTPSPPLPRGWRGRVFLRKSGKNTYALVSSDAAIEDRVRSAPSELPRCSESAAPPPSSSPEALDGATDAQTVELDAGATPVGPSSQRGSCACSSASEANSCPIAMATMVAAFVASRLRRRSSSAISVKP